MSIEIEISGNEQLKYKSNITGYTYNEESTPVVPGDSSGSIGSISFEAVDNPESTQHIFGDEVLLVDSYHGSTTGIIKSLSASDGVVKLEGVSGLGRLNIPRKLTPMSTTIGGFITYLLGEAGILTGFSIDASFSSVSIITPGYEGDLWVHLKDFCTARNIEIALINDTITFRPLRQNVISPFDIVTDGWSIAESTPAQTIEVNYYNYVNYTTPYLAYPKGGWNKDVQVYQVDANQTTTIELPFDGYLTYIEQPTAFNTVPKTYTGSGYCISGNDGLPISAAQWIDNGGSLTAALKDNGQTIVVTLTGANIPNLAPFSVGVSSGPSDYYSSLRIRGIGVFYDKKTWTQDTGLTANETSNVVGTTIDNPHISTLAQAQAAASKAIINYALPRMEYRFTAPALGDFLQTPVILSLSSFAEYDSWIEDGEIFSGIDTFIDDMSFSEFDSNLPSVEIDRIGGQVFGNVAGARIKYRDAWYRIRTASITPTALEVTSEWDNLISDFNSANSNVTFESFNSTFNELSFTDFAIVPMRRD